MQQFLKILRWSVGLLFIFSGLIKANDPLGLSYKMQEFFEVWAREGYLPSFMNMLYDFSFQFSYFSYLFFCLFLFEYSLYELIV